LSVVVKRHSSQRGGEKKKAEIELHFTHIHFRNEQQQSARITEVRTCNKSF